MDHLIPRLIPGSQLVRLDDSSLAVRTWHRTLRLHGRPVARAMAVLEAVDGRRSVAEVATNAQLPTAAAERLLEQLQTIGVVRLSDPDDSATPATPAQVLSDACGNHTAPRSGVAVVIGTGAAATLTVERLRRLGVTASAQTSCGDLDGEPAEVQALVLAEETATYRTATEIDASAAKSGTRGAPAGGRARR